MGKDSLSIRAVTGQGRMVLNQERRDLDEVLGGNSSGW